MNAVVAYFERTMQGMLAFIEEETILVVLLALLLLLWLKEKKRVDNKGNRLLLYTTAMIILLLFPPTAMMLVWYQTAFYDYAWTWSAVPVMAGIAYVAVVLYEEYVVTLSKKYRIGVIGLALAVLFLCGNQGVLLKSQGKMAEAQEHALELVKCIEESEANEEYVLWANSQIMQEVRRQSGNIRLIYGRDMWDEKSGAYDYEEYAEPLVQAYEFMEIVSEVAQDADNPELFRILCDYYEGMQDADIHITNMLNAGVNLIVVPLNASEYFKEVLGEKDALVVQEIFTKQYVLYLLK